MTALPDFLRRIAARLRLYAVAQGVVAAMVIAIAIEAVAIARGQGGGVARVAIGVVLSVAFVVARLALGRRTPAQVASLVERRAPECRNILITAEEIEREPARVRPAIARRIETDAARMIAGLDPTRIVPLRRMQLLMWGSIALWVVAIMPRVRETVGRPPTAAEAARSIALEAVDIDDVTVVVTPPAYTGLPQTSHENPARIDALAGSRVDVRVRATAGSIQLETLDARETIAASGTGTFAGTVTATADGFIAIEPRATDGRPGTRRLIALTVRPDAAPRVRLTAPGQDLFLPDANRTLDVVVEAEDDLALASITLRYTKVTGFGERFTFAEGEVPLQVAREGGRQWRGRGTLPLRDLQLTPGDVIVYRGVATDRRPGAVPAESDAFIVEITAPGAVAAEGFAVDDEMDRYALSQAMVILKTERLIARARSLPADSLQREALTLAAEQRSVRAEFVFMMGGEVPEDIVGVDPGAAVVEEEHAHSTQGEDDVLAGRLANQGRVEIVRAIRSMSQASARLGAVELATALEHEKRALASLQRAFARTRYILRALTQREALDLTRRLTGPLDEAATSRRAVQSRTDERSAALRSALAAVAELSTARDAGTRIPAVAERILRIDPTSEQLRAVTTMLDSARRGGADARRLIDRATIELAAVVRVGAPAAPSAPRSGELGRLGSALADILRGEPR